MAHALAMVHFKDPKKEILDDIGAQISTVQVLGARVLVGVYVRPTKTAAGIILTDKSADEDKYQGKVGLVLKLGPIAFQDDATHRFGDIKPKVGDWVVFNVGDTFGMEVGKRRCRSVEDVDIHMIIERPDGLW